MHLHFREMVLLTAFIVLMGLVISGYAQARETLEVRGLSADNRVIGVPSKGIAIKDVQDLSVNEELIMHRNTKTTATEWRDDDVNIEGVRELNRVYERIPFSREYEGVLDLPPLKLEWSTGANLPVAWKGGVAGSFGDTIVLAAGMWMPDRLNVAYAYDTQTDAYTELPPCPVETQYTQGTYDDSGMYVVGGRASGRQVWRLTRHGVDWKWTDLVPLPSSEAPGRWLAGCGVVSGRRLCLVAGTPSGKPSEQRDAPQLQDWKLLLDDPNAEWEPMAPYPGGPRTLVTVGVARNDLYVFGGSHPDPVLRSLALTLPGKYGIEVPYNGVPNYRDVYRYDPETDEWTSLRNLPFPMFSGDAVTLDERYILLMGSVDVRTRRRGKTINNDARVWRGYGDVIICYDIEQDNYSRIGVMLYGVATAPWIHHAGRLYGFGGGPAHGYNANTENVLQIGTIHWDQASE